MKQVVEVGEKNHDIIKTRIVKYKYEMLLSKARPYIVTVSFDGLQQNI